MLNEQQPETNRFPDEVLLAIVPAVLAISACYFTPHKAKMNTMTVTLYQPGREPEAVEPGGFITQPESGQIVQNAARAAELLGCAPELADVLACGTGYLVYSVFDYEGNANPAAMLLSRN